MTDHWQDMEGFPIRALRVAGGVHAGTVDGMDDQQPVTTVAQWEDPEPDCIDDDVEEHIVRAFMGAPRPVRDSGRGRPPGSAGSRRP